MEIYVKLVNHFLILVNVFFCSIYQKFVVCSGIKWDYTGKYKLQSSRLPLLIFQAMTTAMPGTTPHKKWIYILPSSFVTI